MTNIFKRGWNWCCRFRHRCGYGVHSPSDFFLITFVIYEKMPFYAYDTLKELRKQMEHLPHYREKVDKLLLRLVNYLQPETLLEVGTGSGLHTRYMMAGNQRMNTLTFTDHVSEEVKQLFEGSTSVRYSEGGLQEIAQLSEAQPIRKTMVHIAHTPYYKEVFEQLLPKVDEHSCFIIGSPYVSKEKKRWWKSVIADERVGVTFDLYDIGIVFLDKKRIKEHRIVNFL